MSEPVREPGNGRINVSEEKLLRLLAEFKLELLRDLETRFKETVSQAMFSALSTRVESSELRLSALERNRSGFDAVKELGRWGLPIAVGVAIAYFG